MCESTVYSTNNEVIMEDVMNIKIDDEKIYLIDILGQEKTLQGKIIQIDLDKHGIFVQLNEK